MDHNGIPIHLNGSRSPINGAAHTLPRRAARRPVLKPAAAKAEETPPASQTPATAAQRRLEGGVFDEVRGLFERWRQHDFADDGYDREALGAAMSAISALDLTVAMINTWDSPEARVVRYQLGQFREALCGKAHRVAAPAALPHPAEPISLAQSTTRPARPVEPPPPQDIRRLRKLVATARESVTDLGFFVERHTGCGSESLGTVHCFAVRTRRAIRRCMKATRALEAFSERGGALYGWLWEGRDHCAHALKALDALLYVIEPDRFSRKARRLRCYEQTIELAYRMQSLACDARMAIKELSKLQASAGA